MNHDYFTFDNRSLWFFKSVKLFFFFLKKNHFFLHFINFTRIERISLLFLIKFKGTRDFFKVLYIYIFFQLHLETLIKVTLYKFWHIYHTRNFLKNGEEGNKEFSRIFLALWRTLQMAHVHSISIKITNVFMPIWFTYK